MSFPDNGPSTSFWRQRGTGDQLHRDEVQPFVNAELVNGRDVGMIQFSECEGLCTELLSGGFFAECSARENLHRDVAIELQIMRAYTSPMPPAPSFSTTS